jgi:hypothetical protein
MRPQPYEIQLRERQTYDLPSAPVASAAIALSLKKSCGSPAPGHVNSALRPVAGVEISLAPQRPECRQDREFTLWPRMTGPV